MPRATTFFVVSDEPERLWRAALWALTAASVDEQVRVWLTAPALRALVSGPVFAAGAEAAGLPDARSLLRESRSLGVRILTCETERALAGIAGGDLSELVDSEEPFPSFWRASEGERVAV
jgi:peroxiredoxin family protein